MIGCQDENVKTVKKGYGFYHNEKTVGEAFDDYEFFKDKKWLSRIGKNNDQVVEFRGDLIAGNLSQAELKYIEEKNINPKLFMQFIIHPNVKGLFKPYGVWVEYKHACSGETVVTPISFNVVEYIYDNEEFELNHGAKEELLKKFDDNACRDAYNGVTEEALKSYVMARHKMEPVESKITNAAVECGYSNGNGKLSSSFNLNNIKIIDRQIGDGAVYYLYEIVYESKDGYKYDFRKQEYHHGISVGLFDPLPDAQERFPNAISIDDDGNIVVKEKQFLKYSDGKWLIAVTEEELDWARSNKSFEKSFDALGKQLYEKLYR